MKFKSNIQLNNIELCELITQALQKQGVSISHQDIEFKIEEIEHGDQRDSWKKYELTGVVIKNIVIGE